MLDVKTGSNASVRLMQSARDKLVAVIVCNVVSGRRWFDCG